MTEPRRRALSEVCCVFTAGFTAYFVMLACTAGILLPLACADPRLGRAGTGEMAAWIVFNQSID
jgi:hypothetical protein